jgi:hypothetical protein
MLIRRLSGMSLLRCSVREGIRGALEIQRLMGDIEIAGSNARKAHGEPPLRPSDKSENGMSCACWEGHPSWERRGWWRSK